MKFSTTLIVVAASVVAAAPAPNALPDGVLHMPMYQRLRQAGKFVKRDGKAATIENKQVAYYAEFEVGTPGQKVQGILDTGSSDIWVYGGMSGVKPSYNANDSSTYEYVDSSFKIAYAQGTGAEGDYFKDTLKFGEFSVKDQQMAEVVKKTQPEDGGIFGIGMMGDEVAKKKYPNLPENMKQQGVISRNAYSIYLDDLDASSGSILFGGIDDAKYTGELETVKTTGNDKFEVPVKYNGQEFKALLDSGSTFMSLPEDIVKDIAKKTGAEFNESEGGWLYDTKPSSSVKFMLGNKEIEIKPDELAMDASWVGSESGKPYVMPILPTDFSTNILGQSFMRSCYIVFDADNDEIQIADASYSKSTNVFAIAPMVNKKVSDVVSGALKTNPLGKQ